MVQNCQIFRIKSCQILILEFHQGVGFTILKGFAKINDGRNKFISAVLSLWSSTRYICTDGGDPSSGILCCNDLQYLNYPGKESAFEDKVMQQFHPGYGMNYTLNDWDMVLPERSPAWINTFECGRVNLRGKLSS